MSLNNSGYINNATKNAYAVTGSCSEEGRTVTLGGAVSGSATCTGGGFSVNLNYSAVSDGAVSLTASLSDAAGNSATPASVSLTKDTAAPSSTSIAINGGAASVTTTAVTLTLGATEASEMYLTNTAGCGAGASWESFNSTKSWTLGQTGGTATVYAKFKDSAGNESSCINATITHLLAYSVGGTISGLSGTAVLRNNGADDLSLNANGSFSFVTLVASGNAYAVSVLTQPAGQYCMVSGGSGTVSGQVTSVSVSCGAITCGDLVANNCYSGINSSTLQATGTVTTPLGKSLQYVFANGSSGFKVWKEVGSTRILRANGLDEWAKALNPDGRGLSATDFIDANLGNGSTIIAGRACPTNVYIDASNKFTTDNCLYYSPEYSNQKLNAGGTDGILGFEGWSTPLWYRGNIAICSNKGMRPPTLYEATASDPGGSSKPTADGTPTGWGNAVPNSVYYSWTASTFAGSSSGYWLSWTGIGTSWGFYSFNYVAMCVLP